VVRRPDGRPVNAERVGLAKVGVVSSGDLPANSASPRELIGSRKGRHEAKVLTRRRGGAESGWAEWQRTRVPEASRDEQEARKPGVGPGFRVLPERAWPSTAAVDHRFTLEFLCLLAATGLKRLACCISPRLRASA
jgi:hypothetical protein